MVKNYHKYSKKTQSFNLIQRKLPATNMIHYNLIQ